MTQAAKKGDGNAAVKEAVKGAVKRAAKPAGKIAENTVASTAANSAGSSAENIATNASGWPVDDITGLARRLPEVDPANYFDAQAKESYQQSLTRWPVLARLMKLVPSDAANAAEGGD
jgi:hypothetical protein